jgi:hypothetical protein
VGDDRSPCHQSHAADVERDVDDRGRRADERCAHHGSTHDRGTGADGSDHDGRDRSALDGPGDD